MTRPPASFAEADCRRVNDAIAAAEKWTEAAILPVVVARSSSYERAEGVVGVLAAVGVGLIAALAGATSIVVVVLITAGFGAGVVLARARDDVRLALVPKPRVRAEVAAGAEATLADRRLRRADRDNALVLYVSLLERRAVAAADRRVRAALGDDILRQLERDLESSTEQGDPAGGLVRAIEAIAEPLARRLPRPAVLIDEPPNEVNVSTEHRSRARRARGISYD